MSIGTKMLAEYVLIVYLMNGPKEYIANFVECAHAKQYRKQHYPEYESTCLHEDYIYLPIGLQKIYYYPKTKD